MTGPYGGPPGRAYPNIAPTRHALCVGASWTYPDNSSHIQTYHPDDRTTPPAERDELPQDVIEGKQTGEAISISNKVSPPLPSPPLSSTSPSDPMDLLLQAITAASPIRPGFGPSDLDQAHLSGSSDRSIQTDPAFGSFNANHIPFQVADAGPSTAPSSVSWPTVPKRKTAKAKPLPPPSSSRTARESAMKAACTPLVKRMKRRGGAVGMWHPVIVDVGSGAEVVAASASASGSSLKSRADAGDGMEDAGVVMNKSGTRTDPGTGTAWFKKGVKVGKGTGRVDPAVIVDGQQGEREAEKGKGRAMEGSSKLEESKDEDLQIEQLQEDTITVDHSDEGGTPPPGTRRPAPRSQSRKIRAPPPRRSKRKPPEADNEIEADQPTAMKEADVSRRTSRSPRNRDSRSVDSSPALPKLPPKRKTVQPLHIILPRRTTPHPFYPPTTPSVPGPPSSQPSSSPPEPHLALQKLETPPRKYKGWVYLSTEEESTHEAAEEDVDKADSDEAIGKRKRRRMVAPLVGTLVEPGKRARARTTTPGTMDETVVQKTGLRQRTTKHTVATRGKSLESR